MKTTVLIHNLLTPFKTMFRKLFCDIILIADSHPTFLEKLKYFIMIISAFAPIAYMLDGVSEWFTYNRQFASFVIVCIVANIIIGGIYHHKMKTFSYELFLKRNTLMIAVLVVAYIMLEMLRITVGQNVFAEGFKAIIQVSTLLYPMSKALKNLYILSNKQFPPAFIMNRLYNFEKTGNFKDLYPEQNKNQENAE